MEFVRVVVDAQRFEQRIGGGERGDLLGGEERGQPALPEIMGALDLALGLRSGRVAQRDFVKAERGTKLSERIRGVSEKEGVVIHVERQRQAGGEEGAGQIVQVSEERLARIEPRERDHAAVIIDGLEQNEQLVAVGEPAVRRSIVLPELADLLDGPSAHGPARGFELRIRSEPFGDGPAAHRGAAEFEIQTAKQLGRSEAVGSRRTGGEQLAQKRRDRLRPVWAMITARSARQPRTLAALPTGAQIVGIDDVKAAAAQTEFRTRLAGGDGLIAEARQNIADERSGVS
jgi:hypothetical protein